MASTERLQAIIDPLLAELGFDLESVAMLNPQNRRVLSIVIDGDGGVTLDAIAQVSREISALLDGQDVMGPEPYSLEVSSRGVSSPLELPRHWRRNIGRLVRVKRRDLPELTDRIIEVDDEGVMVGSERVRYSDIVKAIVQVDFKGQ